MNGKELVELLNQHNTKTWPIYVNQKTPDQILALRRELQQGLDRISTSRIILPETYFMPESVEELESMDETNMQEILANRIKHKAINFYGYLDKAFRWKAMSKYLRAGYEKHQADILIEEALRKNAY